MEDDEFIFANMRANFSKKNQKKKNKRSPYQSAKHNIYVDVEVSDFSIL